MTTIPKIAWLAASARRAERQFLSAPAPRATAPADVVAAMLGAHAQVMSAAEVSVGLRWAGTTRSDVRAALWGPGSGADGPGSGSGADSGDTDGSAGVSSEAAAPTKAGTPEARTRTKAGLVKTYGPRGTVHLLPARDLPVWCAALSAVPRGRSPFPPDVLLTGEQERQVVAAIGDALEGVCLTMEELNEEVVARTGPWAGDLVMPAFQGMWPRWRQVLHRAGWSGALVFGPNRGRRVTYTRPPVTGTTPPVPEEALRTFVRRYLHAYGPAAPRHFAKWLAAPVGWAEGVFRELAAGGWIEEVAFEAGTTAETEARVEAGDDARVEAGGGGVGKSGGGGSGWSGDGGWWVVAGDTDFPSDPPRGVRLLPYFDAYVIAAQPRELLFPGAAYHRALAGGQAGNHPVLLVDGVVAGVWHQRRAGRRTTITVEPLGRLTARQEREVGEQAERVGEVLEARTQWRIGEVAVGPHA
ncbi:winged helix DNA-binding domain-containing protein [Streptomyces sp. NPDC005931]|uniref:winged helix DNA-binding domain-containing protein n=1 Tax=Streptomyces sp. NPDC005931 TaxID=3364737 RepID=UPI0036871659